MFTTLLIALLIVGATLWFFPKTRSALFNKGRSVDGEIADSLADPIADGKLAIKDARAELQVLRKNLNDLKTEDNLLVEDIAVTKANIEKYEALAVAAGQANNEADVRLALEQKGKYQEDLNRFTVDHAQNDQVEQELAEEIKQYSDAIVNANRNQVKFVATIKSADIRKKIAERNTNGSGLAGLKTLEENARRANAAAIAAQEVSGISSAGKSLEDKYKVPAVKSDEVNKYLKK